MRVREMARDRSSGSGRSRPAAVVDAWESCLAYDPTCEEATAALMRIYGAQGRYALAQDTYARCRVALEELHLRASPAVEEIHRTIPRQSRHRPEPTPRLLRNERRLVTMLFVEVAPARGSAERGLEEFRELVSTALADVLAQVESWGDGQLCVGSRAAAIFGAPETHEDDPERALRAAYRAVARTNADRGDVVLRAGVESGQAVVGALDGVPGVLHSALGEVVSVAATLQAAARPSSVLVGPAARAASEGLFEWGGNREVVTSADAKPLACCYLGRPRPRPSGQAGRRSLARRADWWAEKIIWGCYGACSRAYLRAKAPAWSLPATQGWEDAPHLRVPPPVHDLGRCRLRTATSVARGRAASYLSAAPFGLYQHVLGSWVGAAPDEPEEIVNAGLWAGP